jgi:hypothetical protein
MPEGHHIAAGTPPPVAGHMRQEREVIRTPLGDQWIIHAQGKLTRFPALAGRGVTKENTQMPLHTCMAYRSLTHTDRPHSHGGQQTPGTPAQAPMAG